MNVSSSNHTLQSLLLAAKRDRQASGRQLAALAQKHGFRVVGTTLNALIAGTYKSTPSDETVRAVAWLAGVTESEAFAAAGLPIPGPPLSDELPPGVDVLSPKARRVVVELLRVLVEQEEGGEHEQRSTSTSPPRSDRGPQQRDLAVVQKLVRERLAADPPDVLHFLEDGPVEAAFRATLTAYLDGVLTDAFDQAESLLDPATSSQRPLRLHTSLSEPDIMLAARDTDDDAEAQAQQYEP